MKKARVTVPSPGGQGTGWVEVDVSNTALDPVAEGDPVILNPIDDVNITTFGLALVRASAPNKLRFGVKLASGPIDVDVCIP